MFVMFFLINALFFAGYYMYIEASRKKKGYNAKLEINPDLPRGKTCMSFFYHMRGGYRQMGTLRVLINDKQVFQKSGNQGSSWIKSEITFDGPVSSVRACCFLKFWLKSFGFGSSLARRSMKIKWPFQNFISKLSISIPAQFQ